MVSAVERMQKSLGFSSMEGTSETDELTYNLSNWQREKKNQRNISCFPPVHHSNSIKASSKKKNVALQFPNFVFKSTFLKQMKKPTVVAKKGTP